MDMMMVVVVMVVVVVIIINTIIIGCKVTERSYFGGFVYFEYE